MAEVTEAEKNLKAGDKTKTDQAVKKNVSGAKQVESEYYLDELTGAADLFNTQKIVVKTALEQTGKTRFTLGEAQDIVLKFRKKEVKN